MKSYGKYNYDSLSTRRFVEPILLPFKGVDGRMQAKITLAVAMNQQSGQKQEAFDLLEIALDGYQQSLAADVYCPILKVRPPWIPA